ncbi:hypothetical protein MUY14_09430 [Amycolatopsis sp. FBCC-B4732]|uniref:hypothetical protein n=1 Tax=Amycolatopsis sp. FBCC-B4732 TaxID=3079339 RepID=UPI001FF1C229|nr:hypothetical protein [Amycolatopsis sp. FBCC-B4732]UOX90826.1 hypothetical protein MUY14_09430 [Amycolatopsis sp. FBCC-B4732]
MKLVELEIARHDWSREHCACGRSAEHVAEDLRRLAGADEASGFGTDALEGHVFVSSFIHEPAVPVVSVALAALADDISDYARAKFLELLLFLVDDDGQSERAAQEGRNLAAECAAAAVPGIWLLYSEVFSGRRVDSAAYAYETLSLVERNEDRLELARAAAGDLPPWDLR